MGSAGSSTNRTHGTHDNSRFWRKRRISPSCNTLYAALWRYSDEYSYIFAYIKIEGLCLELYSRQEQKRLCRELSASLSAIKRPYKSDAVSRPVDISAPLNEYEELYNAATGGRKKLLKFDMESLAEMVATGESLERQHYIAIWDTIQRSDERTLTQAAQDIAKKYSDCGIKAELLDRKGIVQLCNLVNNPAYVHVENANIEDVISVLSAG